jgi:hypothetical protein
MQPHFWDSHEIGSQNFDGNLSVVVHITHTQGVVFRCGIPVKGSSGNGQSARG